MTQMPTGFAIGGVADPVDFLRDGEGIYGVGVIEGIQWTGIRRVAHTITVGVIRIFQRTGVERITDTVAVRVVRVVIGARIIAIDDAAVARTSAPTVPGCSLIVCPVFFRPH